MSDIIRILRVLEYVGPRDDVERGLAQNAVKGIRHFGDVIIREATVGTFPEVVANTKPKLTSDASSRQDDATKRFFDPK